MPTRGRRNLATGNVDVTLAHACLDVYLPWFRAKVDVPAKNRGPQVFDAANMPSLTLEEFATRYPQSDDSGQASGVIELGRGGASSGVERYVGRKCKNLSGRKSSNS